MPFLPRPERKPSKTGQNNNKSKRDPFYHTSKWTKTSKAHRIKFPYCEDCKENGLTVLADITDHDIPRGVGGSDYDKRNHRSMCKSCHNKKRGRESHGYVAPYQLNDKGEKIPL